MSHSKPLPPFTFDVICYLSRDQLEQFSIVCCPLKNLIERYFNSKPYRTFDRLRIIGGLYALRHNFVHWHPNQNDYNVRQFLAGQRCSIDKSKAGWLKHTFYSFAKMRPYLGLTVRVKEVTISTAENTIYNPEHIENMESLAYLWRNGNINLGTRWILGGTGNYLPILNSPTILQCQKLLVRRAHFPAKDYKVLYTVKVIEITYDNTRNCWPEFLEQPGFKPIVVLHNVPTTNFLDRLFEVFSSAVSPNAFKMLFRVNDKSLTEFRETNKTSGEILELKKGIPVEYREYFDDSYGYILERSCT